MIGVVAKQEHISAGKLVKAAIARSVSKSQVELISPAKITSEKKDLDIIVAINPDENLAKVLNHWMDSNNKKLIIFGQLPKSYIERFELQQVEWPESRSSWSRSTEAQTNSFAESSASVVYDKNAELFYAENWQRPLERFDFTNEWNNMGYGAITADNSIWSLRAPLLAKTESSLASIILDDDVIGTYAALFEYSNSSVLWFNRSVGPIDSFEWHIVERYISSWRCAELPCVPVLLETPWGYDAAITMRLDCDEDIESARALWDAYKERNIPFSLAIHTLNLDDPKQHQILHDMLEAGESLLSHTATHAPNWGGSYEAAFEEAEVSANKIFNVTGYSVKYAVSPFHQSPKYALDALCDAGYTGCIGGIIKNDPEFLLARGGELAEVPNGFIGHSQQVMLHGDCLLKEKDPLKIYKAAFDFAYQTKTLFGYLDHPFSPRYQYGWENEQQRTDAHIQIIDYIKSKTQKAMFWSENDALDFLYDKAHINISSNGSRFKFQHLNSGSRKQSFFPTVLFRDQLFEAKFGAAI